jgi:lysophospholipase L1-like esterase
VPKLVLHVGDSTVGGTGGLARALAARFEPEGTRYVRDAWDGVSIATFDRADKIGKMIAAHNPDVVLITLGMNDITIPSPWALDKRVAHIAKQTEGRECYWIGPPVPRKETGIVNVIRKNCAPCKFFDSSHLRLKRRRDGFHPSDEGGEQWAEVFWSFYRPASTEPRGVATAVSAP